MIVALPFALLLALQPPQPTAPPPQAPAVAAPDAEASCDFRPARRTSWTLPAPAPFYRGLAERAKTPYLALVGRLVDDYAASEYTLPEVVGVLDSLAKLAGAKDGRAAALRPAADEPRCGGGDPRDSLVLYIDPTCDACAHVVELATGLAKRCPAFPSLVYRLVPAHEGDLAMDTAAFLESLVRRSPEIYCAAVADVLKAPPQSAAELATVEKQYAAIVGGEPLDTAAARARVAARRNVFPTSDFGAPSVFYRGRHVKSTGAFDPFRTPETLLHATLFIRLTDR